ncbi:MAG: hypothetical protein ACI8SC_002501, partial [Colwellia sp.]
VRVRILTSNITAASVSILIRSSRVILAIVMIDAQQ